MFVIVLGISLQLAVGSRKSVYQTGVRLQTADCQLKTVYLN